MCAILTSDCSAARLRGFEEDLHLEGNQFATVLSVLYVGYISMQAREPQAERLARIPAYVGIFTGRQPSAAELARFEARLPPEPPGGRA